MSNAEMEKLLHDGALSYDSDLYFVQFMGKDMAGLSHPFQEQQLIVRDYDGQTLLACELESLQVMGDTPGLFLMADDEAGGWLAAFVVDEQLDDEDSKINVISFDTSGSVRWSSLFTQPCDWHSGVLAPDGKGGAYLAMKSFDDYRKLVIRHFSADGTILWKKVVSPDGYVLTSWVGEVKDDGCLWLTGIAVSQSQEAVLVVTVTISSEGEIVENTARDFSARKDIETRIVNGIDGVFYACSYSEVEKSLPAVCVPIDELPASQSPFIEIESAGSNVH